MSETKTDLTKAPDALFHYLRTAHRREQAWTYRLLLRNERLLSAGVERLVETAAICLSTKPQTVTGSPALETMSLQELHRAFVEDIESNLDWKTAFQHLWRPVQELLERQGKGRRRV